MSRRFLGIALAILLMMPVFIISCSDDGGGTTDLGPTDTPDVPDIPEAEVTETVDFQSEDPTAKQAEGLVQGMLTSATALTSSSSAFTQPMDNASWTGIGNSCYNWSATYEGCSALYEVCESGNDYVWSLTLNGTCVSQEDPYVNWQAFSGTTSQDGTTGTFRYYTPNTTTVAGAWTWSMSADHKSGTWSFYTGDINTGDLVATLDWVENADGSEDVTWLMPESTKWVLHVETGGTSGYMRSYAWDSTASAWTMNIEITWTINGGAMTYYDSDGEIMSAETWGTGF